MNRIQHDFKKNKGGVPLRLPTGKAVGKLRGTVAAFKVKRSRHFFRALGGYSLDAGIISELERLGVATIEFQDSEMGQTFRVGLETFLARARQTPNYGYGSKLVCHERFYQDDSADDLLPGMMIAPISQKPDGYSAQAGG